jgi:mannan endo-1,4-beta-mannosidase
MKTKIYFRLVVCALLLSALVQAQPKYVQVRDDHFVLDGKPYYFMGTNFWYGCFLGSTGRTGNRDRLIRELDRLKAAGIDNLRILGLSETSASQEAVKPAIQLSPGVYDDSLWVGLDFLLSEMNKREMHAVIFLNNFWNWSGGMAQYNLWFGGGSSFDVSTFYRNTLANAGFQKAVGDLIGRKNTVTGLNYFEDPAIMAWELANEPRPGYFSGYENSFYKWIDTTAHYIHSLDPNHLVTTGSEGTMGSLNSESTYIKAHQSNSIDYATIHLWAKNWGWFDANKISQTYATALSKAVAYIQEHVALARTLNKPLVMEEFGLPRDNERNDPGSLTTARDQYFTAVLQTVYDSAAAGSPMAGSNFWGWGGEGRSPNADFTWRVGDPFVCDPPMEKQGLNSVYDTDSTTIAVIRNHSDLMIGLRQITAVVGKNRTESYELSQNYPNPFNASTQIRFSVPASCRVSIMVYAESGEWILTLLDGYRSAGIHELTFDGSNLTSGVYFYRIQIAGRYVETKKMILMK